LRISERTILGGIAVAVIAVMVLVTINYFRESELRGLLIDLELEGPDPSRFEHLRTALTKKLRDRVDTLRNHRVKLTYVHFSSFDRSLLKSERPDFLLLSPQGTPWYKYAAGEQGRKLEKLKDELKNIILKDDMPVLAICGGHQFLAMAFGGEVDFIDPDYAGTSPESYPKEARGEHGVTILETLRADPIFEGIASYPGKFSVVQSHYEEVKTVPEPFINLAKSETSHIQILNIPGRPIYGLAFHPERGWDSLPDSGPQTQAGIRILGNFLQMVAQRKG
jgi:GMP synthase-like glutamine amidotransferase